MDGKLLELAEAVFDCLEKLEELEASNKATLSRIAETEEKLEELELKFGTELSKPKTMTGAS